MKIVLSYIRQIGKSTWRVFSESGKNLGTYHSLAQAKHRLAQIEMFKHLNPRRNRRERRKKAMLLLLM